MEIFVSFLAGLTLLLGGAYAWWQFGESRFTVVTPGEVYTSAAMSSKRLRRVARHYGIRTVVDLRCPDEGMETIRDEGRVLEEEGVHHLNLQSPQVPPEELRDRFLAWIADPAHRPALIHCNHGEGRAVLYGALWRIEFMGVEPERARRGCRRITTRGSSFDVMKPKGRYLGTYRRARNA